MKYYKREVAFSCLFGFVLVGLSSAKVTPKVTCDEYEMKVELSGPNLLDAYLKGLKNYPDASCLPNRSGDTLRFRLDLQEFHRCGTSQILNTVTGSITFYNHVILIDREGKDTEVLIKCKLEGHPPSRTEVGDNRLNHNGTVRLWKRDLPAGFEESQDIIYGDVQKGMVPDPILTMVVKQEGRTIGQELLVQPGAPLTMEVSHIERRQLCNHPTHELCVRYNSRPIEDVYDIIMSKLDVTDTQDQSEVIIINGCSVDSYLFENFQTSNGQTLIAKFRAFKFPDSSYVLFQGTVNVCLGTCTPSQCSNGQIGYGRRRRSLSQPSDELYVVKVNALLQIENSQNNLDDGTVLFRHKRLQSISDNFRLSGSGNGGGGILSEYQTSGSSGMLMSVTLLLAVFFVIFAQRS